VTHNKRDAIYWRRWMVRKLAASIWGTMASNLRSESSRRRLAKELGVSLGALDEAVGIRRQARENHGFDEQTGWHQMSIRGPGVVFERFDRYAASLQMKTPMCARAMIHWYLLGDDEPNIDLRWRLDGRFVPDDGQGRCQPSLTRGALEALSIRAERLGIRRETLVKCLLCEELEGRRRAKKPVARRAMYREAARYMRRGN